MITTYSSKDYELVQIQPDAAVARGLRDHYMEESRACVGENLLILVVNVGAVVVGHVQALRNLLVHKFLLALIQKVPNAVNKKGQAK